MPVFFTTLGIVCSSYNFDREEEGKIMDKLKLAVKTSAEFSTFDTGMCLHRSLLSKNSRLT